MEKAIRFRHPDYNPDRTQKLITVCPCPFICRQATFHRNPCARFIVILLTDRRTDRQTDEREQTHLPTPLSEVKSSKEELSSSKIQRYCRIIHQVQFCYVGDGRKLLKHCQYYLLYAINTVLKSFARGHHISIFKSIISREVLTL